MTDSIDNNDNNEVLHALVSFARYVNALGFAPAASGMLAYRSEEKNFRRIRKEEKFADHKAYLAFSMPPIVDLQTGHECQCQAISVGLKKSLRETFEEMESRWNSGKSEGEKLFTVRDQEDRIYISVQAIMENPEKAKKFFDEEAKRLSRRGFVNGLAIGIGTVFLVGGGALAVNGISQMIKTHAEFHKASTFGEDVKVITHGVTGALKTAAGKTLFIGGAKLTTNSAAEIINDKNPLLKADMNETQWHNFVIALRDQLQPAQRER